MKTSILSALAISCLSVSTSVSSAITYNAHDKLLTNTTVLNNQTSVPLFNNKYGFLSKDSWITNLSTADNQYYSYDTSHAIGALSNGTLTRDAFIVDSLGNLTIDTSLKLSDKDKILLNNIKYEMINHKQVTAVKDSYNPYSTSIYSNSYFNFTGGNNNWQFLQMGGIETHINISNQLNANKVENSNNLSEDFGLYYIAKAARQTGGIDKDVADNLANYFISQSSLQGQVNENLTDAIISLLVNNDNFYNSLSPDLNLPFDNSSEKYSLNFIFDDSNNLIEVYYKQWDKDLLKPIALDGALNIDQSISTWGSMGSHSGLKTVVYPWKQLKVCNYNQFLTAFSKVSVNFIDPQTGNKEIGLWYTLSQSGDNYSGFDSSRSLNTIFPNNWCKTVVDTYYCDFVFGHASGEIDISTMYTQEGIVFQTYLIVYGGGDSDSDGTMKGLVQVSDITFS